MIRIYCLSNCLINCITCFSSRDDDQAFSSIFSSTQMTAVSTTSSSACIPPAPSNGCGYAYAFLLSYDGSEPECVKGVASSTDVIVELSNWDLLDLNVGCSDLYTNGYSDIGRDLIEGNLWRVKFFNVEVYDNGGLKSCCKPCAGASFGSAGWLTSSTTTSYSYSASSSSGATSEYSTYAVSVGEDTSKKSKKSSKGGIMAAGADSTGSSSVTTSSQSSSTMTTTQVEYYSYYNDYCGAGM